MKTLFLQLFTISSIFLSSSSFAQNNCSTARVIIAGLPYSFILMGDRLANVYELEFANILNCGVTKTDVCYTAYNLGEDKLVGYFENDKSAEIALKYIKERTKYCL